MKTVIRDSNSYKITHRLSHTAEGKNVFLSSRDYDTVHYDLTREHYNTYFEMDDSDSYEEVIYKLAQGHIFSEVLRLRIATYNGLLLDKVIYEAV
jgi:hypothetical protein